MIALDTNIIVRLVTADDPEQLRVAKALFEAGDLWICKTVLLETEWVLRYTYRLGRSVIQEAYRKLLGYPQLQVEGRSAVIWALALYEQGLDFADALHLASCGDSDRFATFDRPLSKRIRSLQGGPRVVLLQGDP